MRTHLHIVEPDSDGEPILGISHGCPPVPIKSKSESVVRLDDVLKTLTLLRKEWGNVPLMVSLNSATKVGGKYRAVMPYMPVTTIGIDDDDPDALALICVEGEFVNSGRRGR